MSQDENKPEEAPLSAEDVTPESIEAADRKTLDQMAALLDVEVPNRTRIDDLKDMLKKAIAPEETGPDQDDEEPIVPPGESPDPSPDARQARRDEAKRRRAARSEKRRLRNTKTGRIFVWTPALAKHKDMVPAADAE